MCGIEYIIVFAKLKKMDVVKYGWTIKCDWNSVPLRQANLIKINRKQYFRLDPRLLQSDLSERVTPSARHGNKCFGTQASILQRRKAFCTELVYTWHRWESSIKSEHFFLQNNRTLLCYLHYHKCANVNLLYYIKNKYFKILKLKINFNFIAIIYGCWLSCWTIQTKND